MTEDLKIYGTARGKGEITFKVGFGFWAPDAHAGIELLDCNRNEAGELCFKVGTKAETDGKKENSNG